MPPTRRPLRALGSLQLIGYANNPTRVITELAFIADAQVNAQMGLEGTSQSDLDAPLEVQFEEFMTGVNSRGRGTNTRQRKMTVEQAAAVLLVTVQKGHVELIAKEDDPHSIDVIRILPEAKKILAAFLPKLRGYGDIPYDQQYRGAIALAKRHFFPKGRAPTKKELMALLLQTYQEKRELVSKCQTRFQRTKTLGIQTSLKAIDGSPYIEAASGCNSQRPHQVACTSTAEVPSTPLDSKRRGELPNNGVAGVEPSPTTPEVDLHLGNDDSNDNDNLLSVPDIEAASQAVVCTPVVSRSLNPYMTPVSNPRHVDHTAAAPVSRTESPTPGAAASNSDHEIAAEDSTTDDGIGEMLQATATSQGRLNYYYNKFITACQKVVFLEGEREEIQKKFDMTKKKLDETEQRLQEANAERWKSNKMADRVQRQIDSIYNQLGLLRRLTGPEDTDSDQWSVRTSEIQGAFDPNRI